MTQIIEATNEKLVELLALYTSEFVSIQNNNEKATECRSILDAIISELERRKQDNNISLN